MQIELQWFEVSLAENLFFEYSRKEMIITHYTEATALAYN